MRAPMRQKKYRAYREQQLAKIAVAAGASFGWSDEAPAPASDWQAQQRMAGYIVSALLLAPVLTSAAWYLGG